MRTTGVGAREAALASTAAPAPAPSLPAGTRALVAGVVRIFASGDAPAAPVRTLSNTPPIVRLELPERKARVELLAHVHVIARDEDIVVNARGRSFRRSTLTFRIWQAAMYPAAPAWSHSHRVWRKWAVADLL